MSDVINSIKRKLEAKPATSALADAAKKARAAEQVQSEQNHKPLPALLLEQIRRKHEGVFESHTKLPLCCTFDENPETQKIYACVQCMVKAGDAFGVCANCFVTCHYGHCVDQKKADQVPLDNVDFFELDRKRKFVCDCGTKRAPTDCVLKMVTSVDGGPLSVPEDQVEAAQARAAELRASHVNENNTYSQNFNGKYCWCAKKWDYEQETAQEMRQCELCCEWYHDLDCLRAADNLYIGDLPHALICRDCFVNCEPLHNYLANAVPVRPIVDIESTVTAPTPAPVVGNGCKKPLPPTEPRDRMTYNVFCNWSATLCDCESCTAALTAANVAFLLREEATDDYTEPLPSELSLNQELAMEMADLDANKKAKVADTVSVLKRAMQVVLSQKTDNEFTLEDSERVKTLMAQMLQEAQQP